MSIQKLENGRIGIEYNPNESCASQREKIMPAADIMIVAALYKEIRNNNPKFSDDIAYQAAFAIYEDYKEKYSDGSREYHLWLHVGQLFSEDALQILGEEINKNGIPFVGNDSFKEQVLELGNNILTNQIAETIRHAVRHDVLYKLGVTQPALVAEYTKEGSTALVESIFTAAAGIKADKEPRDYAPNEFSSAVYAVVKENEILQNNSLKPLSPIEVFGIAVNLAATVPFEGGSHLDDMATRLYKFLASSDQDALREQLLGKKSDDDAELKKFIDRSVFNAGHTGNNDLMQLASIFEKDVKGGDEGVDNNPLAEFASAYRRTIKHSSADQVTALDPLHVFAKTGGFMYQQWKAGRIFHDFKASLSGDYTLQINNAAKLHQAYADIIPKVIEEHKVDLVLATLKIANALGVEGAASLTREKIAQNMDCNEQKHEDCMALAKKMIDIVFPIDKEGKRSPAIKDINMLLKSDTDLFKAQAEDIIKLLGESFSTGRDSLTSTRTPQGSSAGIPDKRPRSSLSSVYIEGPSLLVEVLRS